MQITSPQNSHLQEIRKAAHSGRPTASGLVVAEGPHLLEEALRSMWAIESVLLTNDAAVRFGDLLPRVRAEIVEVSERAFAGATATENSQGILALLRPREFSWSDLIGGQTLLVVLDAIQDPGNAGAIVRSAEAFGATGLALLKGSARIANGKFLRAAAGSLFRLPHIENLEVEEFLKASAKQLLTVYTLSVQGARDIGEVDWRQPCALVVGNEGAGISNRISHATVGVCVPTGNVESLNAAVACSIALYEASRHRSRA